ncbi:hypothetical protein L226DRAFT_615081 [Lentinus tigrinus ALCF2SS1-7]|uniref:Uncharacterized protein n=1 Tax=Lentinus tigrinus ALCF2SS1-6 TaxID=1328759 RepID=A0A5C2S1V9_9APHY|nr:hypothetical protein L227DRAFT_655550 [Lentinus tigrinus ALCF2SS1-6]RPD72086.1 hypothetical protein L226DRAFT_615081 [Lentinus tigrinus ALCF2SS1-7]
MDKPGLTVGGGESARHHDEENAAQHIRSSSLSRARSRPRNTHYPLASINSTPAANIPSEEPRTTSPFQACKRQREPSSEDEMDGREVSRQLLTNYDHASMNTLSMTEDRQTALQTRSGATLRTTGCTPSGSLFSIALRDSLRMSSTRPATISATSSSRVYSIPRDSSSPSISELSLLARLAPAPPSPSRQVLSDTIVCNSSPSLMSGFPLLSRLSMLPTNPNGSSCASDRGRSLLARMSTDGNREDMGAFAMDLEVDGTVTPMDAYNFDADLDTSAIGSGVGPVERISVDSEAASKEAVVDLDIGAPPKKKRRIRVGKQRRLRNKKEESAVEAMLGLF